MQKGSALLIPPTVGQNSCSTAWSKEIKGQEVKLQVIKGLVRVTQDFQSSSTLSLTPGIELGKPHQCWGRGAGSGELMALECVGFVTHVGKCLYK